MEEQLIPGRTFSSCSSSLREDTAFYKYDVFLSFRGLDLRKKFTSHLYDRLIRFGFQVYLDEKEMDKGEEINEDLKRAIVNSRICIPIFSKNYASSKACLRELSHMVQYEKKIIPIFYDVTPADVKLRTELYKEHLEEHRQNPKVEPEVREWEHALVMVAKKLGHDLRDKDEAEEITTIIEVLIRLIPKDQHVTNKLVEIEHEVKCVEELLNLGSNDFRIVGIFGAGGIGKTTLSKVVFNKLKSNFSSCCSFLENVRENSQSHKLLELQKQLYKDITDRTPAISTYNHNEAIELIRRAAKNKKILLVLDDINDKRQLTDLFGNPLPLTSGSRLIITTRNRKVLDDLNRDHKNVQAYELNEMDGDRAYKLFSKWAFMEDSPPEEYESLSKEVVSYTGGFPLALEVFGSLLSGNNKDDWREILEQLKKFPDKSIETRLMISYHELRSNEQKIFLDIAWYFGKLNKMNACYMWEDCGWYPKLAVKTLEDRCLIKIIVDGDHEYFWMHDVLKDLGRALIQDEADKSNRMPSRLQIDDLNILDKIEERAHVEILIIDDPNSIIVEEELYGFQNLRFLELNVHVALRGFNELFPRLRWFDFYADRFFEEFNFKSNNLVVLKIVVFKRLKEEIMRAVEVDKLKVLIIHDVDHYNRASENLEWVLNATNIEKLDLRLSCNILGLEEMSKLEHIRHLSLERVTFQYPFHLPSSLFLLKLHTCEFSDGILDVSNLKNLISFEVFSPDKLNEIKGLEKLYSLEALHLAGWVDINTCIKDIITMGHPNSLKELTISSCSFPVDLSNLSSLKGLSSLELHNCKDMVRKVSFDGLESLISLSITCCPSIETLLDLSTMRKLRRLVLRQCDRLGSVQGIPQLESLEYVEIYLCDSLELSAPDLTKLESVRSVQIEYCKKLPRIPSLLTEEAFWRADDISMVIYEKFRDC